MSTRDYKLATDVQKMLATLGFPKKAKRLAGTLSGVRSGGTRHGGRELAHRGTGPRQQETVVGGERARECFTV